MLFSLKNRKRNEENVLCSSIEKEIIRCSRYIICDCSWNDLFAMLRIIDFMETYTHVLYIAEKVIASEQKF